MTSDLKSSRSSAISEYLIDRYISIKKFFGIVDKKVPISFEISEFMQESESSLQKLPERYRKIYELAPAKGSFFVNREKELKVLEDIYTNWKKNRFVTCAIVGEKGSGISSILDAFISTTSSQRVIRVELHEKIDSKEEYFRYFNSLFNTKGISSNQGFIDFLNTLEDTKIIILENLHHMYLKKIGGFEAIKLLFELISYSAKKVLWIGAFTTEAWSYLDKTLSISNFFTSPVDIEPLSLEHIKETITIRNSYANLEIEFIGDKDNQEEKEEQKALEEQFFKQLHRVSNGNISLAFLYWVRAIEKIEKDRVYVKEIDDLDYSFIKNLSTEALFVLQTLILHDGLTLEGYSSVAGESSQECRKRFMPMLEKGLLIQPYEKYNINPVVYKHIHNYLSSKNYIH